MKRTDIDAIEKTLANLPVDLKNTFPTSSLDKLMLSPRLARNGHLPSPLSSLQR